MAERFKDKYIINKLIIIWGNKKLPYKAKVQQCAKLVKMYIKDILPLELS